MGNIENYIVIAWWIFLIALIVGFLTMLFVWWWIETLRKIRENERINYRTDK